MIKVPLSKVKDNFSEFIKKAGEEAPSLRLYKTLEELP